MAYEPSTPRRVCRSIPSRRHIAEYCLLCRCRRRGDRRSGEIHRPLCDASNTLHNWRRDVATNCLMQSYARLRADLRDIVWVRHLCFSVPHIQSRAISCQLLSTRSQSLKVLRPTRIEHSALRRSTISLSVMSLRSAIIPKTNPHNCRGESRAIVPAFGAITHRSSRAQSSGSRSIPRRQTVLSPDAPRLLHLQPSKRETINPHRVLWPSDQFHAEAQM
jgi:hypothetical protein